MPAFSFSARHRFCAHWPVWHVVVLVLLPVLVHLPELLGPALWGGATSDPISVLSAGTQTRRNWLEGGILPGLPGWIDGCAGVIVQALGYLAAADWRHGILPWWNPYSGVGMPLAGEYQPGAFFLPFVLLLGLPGGLLFLKITLQILAGFCMYALLRKLGMDARVVLAGAVLWAFNGTFAWASDGPSQPLAFLPLALLGVEVLRGTARGWAGVRNWSILVLGLGGMVLSSFPETAFLQGTLVLCWALLRLAQQPAGARAPFAAAIAVGGSTALLLAAPQLVAFATYLPHAWVGDHAAGISITQPITCWAMALFPYINGPIFYGPASRYEAWWSVGGYWGVLLPFLAILGLWGRRERAARILLAAYFVACVGKQANLPGIAPLVDMIPGIALTFFHRFCYPMEEMALLLLATFGLDDVCRNAAIWSGAEGAKQRTKSWLATTWPALCAGGVLLLATYAVWRWNAPARADLWGFTQGPVSSRFYAFGSVLAGGVLVALCLAALLLPILARWRVTVLASAVVAEALFLFCVPLLSTRSVLPVDVTLINTMKAQIGLNRFVSLGGLAPNYGTYFGLASINHNGVPMPAAWIARLQHDFGPNLNPVTFDGITPNTSNGHFFLQDVLGQKPEVLERLGVVLAVVPHGMALPGQKEAPAEKRLQLLYSSAANDLYRLPHPTPYFEAPENCEIQPLSRTALRTNCRMPATLIRHELMLPGWHVRINGQEAALGYEENLFQRIALPNGPADIRFSFTPPGMAWGWAGLVFGLALLGLGFGRGRNAENA